MQLTWDLGMDHVRSWVLSGDYEHHDSFQRPLDWSSTVATGLSEAAAVPRHFHASTHPNVGVDATLKSDPRPSSPASTLPSLSSPSSSQHTMELLRGSPDHVDDVLIPKDVDVRRVFHNGHQTWHQFVQYALNLPRGEFPAGLDPSMMFKDMPKLPDSIPQKGVLAGAPSWNVPDPDTQKEPVPGDDLDLNSVTGTTKYFRLGYPEPINCQITSDPNASYYGSSQLANAGTSNAPQGLAVLTMCWSYIFSTRLLQLQGRRAHYTDSCLRPTPKSRAGGVDDLAEKTIPIRLPREASASLVHWLCALLAPNPGWKADDQGGPFSPWAAACTGDHEFVIVTEEQVVLDASAQPPSYAQGTDLLIEFCNLFGIDHELSSSEGSVPLSPIKAAFLATLSIPFYRMAKLQPQFLKPILNPKETTGMCSRQVESIRQYTDDLQYYMTLSMHQYSLGPVLWSIFWNPTIRCNEATPWLTAIKTVLGPYIEAHDFELLAKVFALRRPRVAFWWHGLFLLGNSKILEFISRYLDSLDEGCTYDTLSRPDIVTTAWTGVPHSYQDDTSAHIYEELAASVPRADLLRHRHTLTLRDPWPLFYGWRPFGSIPKESIEPDLYPWLERGHLREYQHWTWWAKDDPQFQPVISTGFRQETKRFDPAILDRVDVVDGPDPCAPLPSWIHMPLEPSKRATLQMIAHSLGNIIGERSISTAVVPGLTLNHPWLKDWTPA